jgi:hypothetical protein
MIMEAIRTSETSVYFHENVRRFIPESCHIQPTVVYYVHTRKLTATNLKSKNKNKAKALTCPTVLLFLQTEDQDEAKCIRVSGPGFCPQEDPQQQLPDAAQLRGDMHYLAVSATDDYTRTPLRKGS